MAARGRRTLLLLFFIILLCCLITPVYGEQLTTKVNISQAGAGSVPRWSDTFVDQNSRWDWSYYSGYGTHTIQIVDNKSVVRLRIPSQGDASGYSDSSLRLTSLSEAATDTVFEARIKLNYDTVNDAGVGTAGWGLYNGSTSNPTFAWFWLASDDSGTNWQGLRIMVAINGVPYYNIALNMTTWDVRQWHVYRIHSTPGHTYFYVDDTLVGDTTYVVDKSLRVEVWNDNHAIANDRTVTNLDPTIDQDIYWDWVNVYDVAHWNGISSGDPTVYAADVDGAWSASAPGGSPLYAMTRENRGHILLTICDYWEQKMADWFPLFGPFDGTTGQLHLLMTSQANGNIPQSLTGTFTLTSPTTATFTITSCTDFAGNSNCGPVGSVMNFVKLF